MAFRTADQMNIIVKVLTRSDSAMAKPQVGNATQAELDNLTPVYDKLSNLYCAKSAFIRGTSSPGISDSIKCWFAVNLNSPLCTFAISRKPFLNSFPGSSWIRPFSMNIMK